MSEPQDNDMQVAGTGEAEAVATPDATGAGPSADAMAADAPVMPVVKPVPDRATCKRILEGALLAAGETLNIDRLGTLFEEHERPDAAALRDLLAEIGADFEGHGIELREVASGFRFQVRKELGPWVSRLWTEKAPRYSRALMETLALIAYRQPITRGEIEEVRGVTVSSDMIKSLLERDWIRVVGHRDVPGRPALYATTHDFLDYFNLKALDELPTLSEIRDLDKVNEELQLEAAPATALMAVEQAAAAAGAGEGAPVATYGVGQASDDDLDLSGDMQQVDEVLKRIEDSFRRKPDGQEEGEEGAPPVP